MAMSLRVVVPPHPLIGHWLTMLRHRETPAALYATALQELGRWLTYEALRDWLPHRREMVPGLHGDTEGTLVEASVPLIAIPVLPAGLELWQGGRSVLPDSTLCLGSCPQEIEANAGVILFVDQISDGEATLKLLQELRSKGVDGRRLRLITALCASPGLKLLGEAIPDLTLHTACIDEGVGEQGEIRPGIGDPVRRLNLRS
ncbi:MAG: uracil phosphoribosyltransferase [Cyanobacteria bacterium MAG STY2_bin_7]|nr:uracil phosphoribosyltransferase [Cyanobacteria bacterium MAG STY2_bin_7]